MIKVVLLALAFYLGWMAFYVIYFDDWRLPECIMYVILGFFSFAASTPFKWPQNLWWNINITEPFQKWAAKAFIQFDKFYKWFTSQLK